MQLNFVRRRYIVLWQIIFLVLATSWFWAPHLNSLLNYRTSLISQYETSGQPYSWLFRICDFSAGAWLAAMAIYILKTRNKTAGWLLILTSIGLMADPLLTTTCRTIGNSCQEYFSLNFALHAAETILTASLFFILGVYDSWARKRLVSIVFTIFQIVYGLLFLSQLADQDRFNSASQYTYQAILVVWLAWFCRDLLVSKRFPTGNLEAALVRNSAAAWSFINGVAAIVISLAHINLLGHIRGLYFTGNSAWLAQHGIAVGVIMIYLSRHLARGESRARQIFLLLVGIETIKYSVVSPSPGLMLFYFMTFVLLFSLGDSFNRGTVPLTWQIRLRDLAYLMSGLLLSALLTLLALDRDNRVSIVTTRAAENFSDYVFRGAPLPHRHINSVLLAHSASVFIAASGLAILWVLFRPYKIRRSISNYEAIKEALKAHSASSEDYFKLWPADKDYFWSQNSNGFVAYKIVGATAFALADPVSPNKKELIIEFNDWCRSHRLKICYLPVYPDSLPYYEGAGLEKLQIGSSALIDIETFLNETVRDKWWRWRINRAQKADLNYGLSLPPHSKNLMNSFKRVSDAWLKVGGHTERGFALGYFNEQYLQKCVIHYLADAEGKIVAFANELPQFKEHEIMTIDLLRYLPETDSMAYLLYKTIEQGQSHNRLFDLGFVPFARARGPLLAIAKTVSADKFSAKGLEQFKNKFNPEWQPNYLVYDGDLTDLAVIALNIEKAMSLTNK